MKYKIVYRGKIKPNLSHDQIIENLSELLDESLDDIRSRFFDTNNKELVLISDLDSQDADEYKAALEEAGLIADIDIDFDENFGFNDWLDDEAVKAKPVATNENNLEIFIEPVIEESATTKNADIRKKFLEAQDFTLAKIEEDAVTGEVNRVEKLKKIAKKVESDIVIVDNNKEAIPPMFDSGVRVGRVRFIYRITLAFAILMACLNILPIQLFKVIGNTSIVVTIIMTVVALIFVLIVITQRLCDLDNLSIGKMAFVTIILCTLFLSIMINDYYALNAEKIKFAKHFLQLNALDSNFFNLQSTLDNYLANDSQSYLLKKIDSIIKWFVYVVVIIGAIALFALPGIKGNNQYGSPSGIPTVTGAIIFIICLIGFIYASAYPYRTPELRAKHRLYQVDVYEYLGVLKPLPPEFEEAYQTYLRKKATK